MILRDVIYGNIELEGIYEEIVKSKDFSRLKDIIQTAFNHIQYPELEQETRYEHSIGVYHLMCRTLNNLERKLSAYGLHISKEERELAKLAALLHDIGHGVNSHLLEEITGVSHEQRGIDIIQDPTTEIHQIIKKHYGEDFVQKLTEFMNCIYGNGEVEDSIELRDDNTLPLKGLIATLISHNIDLDRIDYLMRESTYTEIGTLTNYQELTNSFECILAGNRMVLAIPQEKKFFLEANILERTRNYSEIYFCDADFTGNYAFIQLLLELRKHPEEVPETIPNAIRKFLTQEKADFTSQEYMELTTTPVEQAISQIAQTTQNEKIKYLCHYKENAKNDYQVLYNGRSENYIRNLLKRVIPNFPEDSHCIFSQERIIKPYKKTKFGSTNIITKVGIQKFEDLPNSVSLKPIKRSVIAINPELLRLELGLSQEEFRSKYADLLKDIITNQSKPVQDFELKYLLTEKGIYAEEIMDVVTKKYPIVDSATYNFSDYYYDCLEDFSLLGQGKALRIRHGNTEYRGEKSRGYKSKRITYKTYEEEGATTYTNRAKQEEIGSSLQIQDYVEFLTSIGVTGKLKNTLDVNGYRKLVTVKVNDQLIDVSFCVANYQNCINGMQGCAKIIEIRPRDNQIVGRALLLQIKRELEEVFPQLQNAVTNANVYEIGMADTHEKYKKGYIVSKDAEEFERENSEAAKKLADIIKNLIYTRHMTYITRMPTVEEANKNRVVSALEGMEI